jgi:hypothetical protein
MSYWSALCDGAYNGKPLHTLLEAARVSCAVTVRPRVPFSVFMFSCFQMTVLLFALFIYLFCFYPDVASS